MAALLFGRRKCVGYIGRLQGFWPIRATEREMGIDLVLSQLNLIFCEFQRDIFLSGFLPAMPSVLG